MPTLAFCTVPYEPLPIWHTSSNTSSGSRLEIRGLLAPPADAMVAGVVWRRRGTVRHQRRGRGEEAD